MSKQPEDTASPIEETSVDIVEGTPSDDKPAPAPEAKKKVKRPRLSPQDSFNAAIEKALAKSVKDTTTSQERLHKAFMVAGTRLIRQTSSKRTREKNRPKDCPRKAPTDFFLFRGDHQEKVRAENPGMKMPDIASLMGARWRALTDEQKAPYIERARAAHAEYKVAMTKYKAKKAIEDAAEALAKKKKAAKKEAQEDDTEDEEEEEEEEAPPPSPKKKRRVKA